MPLMNSLKKIFKGSKCGCSSTKRNKTRKHKRSVRRRYRGGYSYSSSKQISGDIVFNSRGSKGSKGSKGSRRHLRH